MLCLFAVFFSQTASPPAISEDQAINVSTDPTYGSYTITGDIAVLRDSEIVLLGVGITLGLSFLASWAIKSPIPIGVGLFISIIALFTAPAAIIYQLDPTHNWIVSGIITVISIIIGILAALSIVEMFTQQQGVD